MTEVNHHSLCKYGKVNSTRNAFIWHYYAINWQCVWYGYDLLELHWCRFVLTGFECRPAVQAVVHQRARPAAHPQPHRISVDDPRRRQTFRLIWQKPHVPR